MSQLDKLIQKILNLSNNLRFEELKKILEAYGYTTSTTGTGGSHITFRKKGCNPITIPKHKKLLKVYVEMVKEVLEREEHKDDE